MTTTPPPGGRDCRFVLTLGAVAALLALGLGAGVGYYRLVPAPALPGGYPRVPVVNFVDREVFGEPGTTATINYQDVHAAPQRVDNAPLPWSYTITTTDPAVIANVIAQGNGNTLSCRITVNGVVKDERTVNELNAYTFCLDKSG